MAVQGIFFGAATVGLSGLQSGSTAGTTFRLPASESSDAVTVARAADPARVVTAARFADRAAANGRGSTNAKEAADLVKTADAAFKDIQTRLTSLKTIVKDANKTGVSDTERAIHNAEFTRLRAEIDDIAQTTEFNDTQILVGNGASDTLSIDVEVGGDGLGADDITIGIKSGTSQDLATGFDTAEIATSAGATAATAIIDTAIATADTARGDLRAASAALDGANLAADREGTASEAARGSLVAPTVEVDITLLGTELALENRGVVPELQDSQALRKAIALFERANRAAPVLQAPAPATATFSNETTKTESTASSTSSSSTSSSSSSSTESQEPSVDISA